MKANEIFFPIQFVSKMIHSILNFNFLKLWIVNMPKLWSKVAEYQQNE